MKTTLLNARIRTETGKGKARRNRKAGNIPINLYGGHKENLILEIQAKEFSQLLSHITESTLIELNIQGRKDKPITLLRQIQRHPLTRNILHIDFLRVVMTEKVKLEVSVKLENTDICQGVKSGGMVEFLLRDLEVECLPADIPEMIYIDVKDLDIGDSVYVKDIQIDNVTIHNSPELSIVSVVALRILEVEEAVEEGVEEGEEGEEGVEGVEGEETTEKTE